MPVDRYAAQRVAFPVGANVRATRAFAYHEGKRILAAYPAGAWATVARHEDDGRAAFRFHDGYVIVFPYDDVRDVPMEVIEHPEQEKLDALDRLCWKLFVSLQRLQHDRGETWTPAHRQEVQQLLESAKHVLTVDNGTPEPQPTLPKRD